MMKFATAIPAFALLLVSGNAQAHDPCCQPCYTVKWIDQPVTCQKMEWRVRDVPCEVMKPVCRQAVRVVQRDVVVPEWCTEMRSCTTNVMQPRVVTRDVCRTVMVPVCVVDPCTGCAQTVCKPQTVIDKQCCTVYECVPVTTQVPVKVCRYRTEKRDFQETYLCHELQKVIVVKKESYCVPVTYTTCRKVAVLVPCCP
jgi:hypothetical protein